MKKFAAIALLASLAIPSSAMALTDGVTTVAIVAGLPAGNVTVNFVGPVRAFDGPFAAGGGCRYDLTWRNPLGLGVVTCPIVELTNIPNFCNPLLNVDATVVSAGAPLWATIPACQAFLPVGGGAVAVPAQLLLSEVGGAPGLNALRGSGIFDGIMFPLAVRI